MSGPRATREGHAQTAAGHDQLGKFIVDVAMGATPATPKEPICAIGGTDFLGHGPGVAKAEDPPPAAELTPHFIFITERRIWIRMAPPISPHQS